MTVTDENGGNNHFEDFLYLAQKTDNPTPPIRPGDPGAPGNPGVPEPATLLLWTLGTLGLGTSWARKRQMKKLALL